MCFRRGRARPNPNYRYTEEDKTSGDFRPTNAADRLAHTDNEYVNPGTGSSVPDWKRDRGDTTNLWRQRQRLEYDQRRADHYAQYGWGEHGYYGTDTEHPDYISGDS